MLTIEDPSQLSERDRTELDRHTERCAPCAALAREMLAVASLLELGAAQAAPDTFEQQVMARLRPVRASVERRAALRAARRAPAPLVRKRYVAGAAGVLAVLTLTLTVFGGPSPYPQPGTPLLAEAAADQLWTWADAAATAPDTIEPLLLSHLSHARVQPFAGDPGLELISYHSGAEPVGLLD